MINADQLRQLTARADQGYLLLFCLGLMIAGMMLLLWRVRPIQITVARLSIPLPRLTLPALLLIGLVVRLPHMFDSFWYDETFTARMASLPLAQLPTAILGDVHPPLWYLIEWVTVRLIGNSEFALRFPSLVFGVLLIYLAYRMVLSLGLSREVALLSAALVALLPAPAYYAAEARCYSLLACFAVALVLALAEDRRRLFCLAGIGIVWTHNLGVFYLGMMGLAALVFYGLHPAWGIAASLARQARPTWTPLTEPPDLRRRLLHSYDPDNGIHWMPVVERPDAARLRGRWIVTLVLTALGASLWLPFLFVQSQRVAGNFWIQALNPGGVLLYLTDETIGRRLPDAAILPLYLALFALLCLALVTARRWLKSAHGLLYLSLIIGVPLSIALVSVVWRPVYLTRALLPCGVGLVVLWAYLLIHSPAKSVLRLVTVFVLAGGLVSFYLPSVSRSDMRGYLKLCAGVDAVYATSIPAAMFSSYYVQAPLTAWTDAGDLNQSLTPEAKAAFLLVSADDPPYGDVCVLALDTPMTTDKERAEIQRLRDRYAFRVEVASVSELFTVRVYRFQIDESAVAHAQ